MLLKNGQRFKANGFRDGAGTAYPAGYAAKHPELWPELGITEVIPEARPDPRFNNSSLNWKTGKWSSTPKKVEDVRLRIVSEAKQRAYSTLAKSDWRIIKSTETLDPCREDYLDYREATRERCNEIEEAAGLAETLEDLQAVDTGSWPASPEEEAKEEDLTITEPET